LGFFHFFNVPAKKELNYLAPELNAIQKSSANRYFVKSFFNDFRVFGKKINKKHKTPAN